MRLNSFRRTATALALAGAVLAVTVPAAMAKSVVVPPSKSSDTIVAIASANPAFSTLVAAVDCADPAVGAALTSGGQLTVFAPTNAAFGALGLTAANVCTLPQGTLTAILLYHVQEGRHFSNSVLPKFPGHSKTIDTLLGQSFRVNSVGAIRTTSGSTSPSIVTANIPARNGVIHVVDAVLIPSL